MTSLLGAGINIVLNTLLIPSPLGIQGAAIATFASYFIVFLVRSRNARQLIHFRLFKKALLLSTAVLTVQILFIIFAWTGWQIVQCGAIIAMLLIGRKQILERIRVFRKNAGGI